MRHASLFTGIGGFDLAAKWMGWENVMQCEIDPFCQRVLRHHFPTAHLYGDIREIDGTAYRGKIDILTGGFPCQPFSAAGKRRGTEDNRFLWPEMLRVIREIQPTWIVAENVRGIVSIEGGLVFDGVCSDLEENGYEVQPFCIPACAVGAPHKRERMWFIAHNGRERGGSWASEEIQSSRQEPKPTDSNHSHINAIAYDANTGAESLREQKIGFLGHEQTFADSEGRRRDYGASEKKRKTPTPEYSSGDTNGVRRRWNEAWLQAATRLCRVDDGISEGLDGITVPRWRKESLKAYGNAIVPQVALEIFKAISVSS